MAFLKVLLSCNLIFNVATAYFVYNQDDLYVLSNDSSPQHYNIKFIPYIDDDFFYGECNIKISIARSTQLINFVSENLAISEIELYKDTEISELDKKKIYVPKSFSYYYIKTHIFNIMFDDDLLGNYIMDIKFIGIIGDNGGFKSCHIKTSDEVMLLTSTYFQAATVQRLFPCWNISLKSSFDISIKHHTQYTALSNMPTSEVLMAKNNMQWTHFKTNLKMPTHFIAAAVTNFISTKYSTDGYVPVNMWFRENMTYNIQFAYSIILNVTRYLKEWSDINRKSDMNHLVIPNYQNEGKGNLGFILYNEADVIYDNEIDSIGRKIEIQQLIGREMLYEWLNYVNKPPQSDSYIQKGFATIFGNYILDKVSDVGSPMQFLFVVQTQQECLRLGTNYNKWPPTSQANSSFEIPRYIKASIMFRMLQEEITEDVFWANIKEQLYISYHSVSFDFWNYMQNDLNYKIEYKLGDGLDHWTLQNHYPIINVTHALKDFIDDQRKNYTIIYIKTSMESQDIPIDRGWIHITLTTQSHCNFHEFLHSSWIKPYLHDAALYLNNDNLKEHDWIMINLKQNGFYRAYYYDKNWQRIAIYLNSEEYNKIHVLNRAQIIDDTFYFAMKGQLNSTVALNIFHYLWQDADYIAWYPMFKNLEYMSTFFAFPESLHIKRDIAAALSEVLKKIKYPDFKSVNETQFFKDTIFTKCLREEAARWLCIIAESSDVNYCFDIARDLLEWYFSTRNVSSPHKIWPGWKEWTFCNGLMIASNYTWMKVLLMYKNESDTNLLRFLACSKDPFTIRNYIRLMGLLAYLEKVTDIDHVNSFCFIIARHANNTLVLNYILDNLEKIKPKKISVPTALNIIINHIYSKDHINKIQKYVENNFIGNPVFPDINFGKYCENELGYEVRKFLLIEDINMKRLIMYLKLKLELREAQITTQLNQFRYLYKTIKKYKTIKYKTIKKDLSAKKKH